MQTVISNDSLARALRAIPEAEGVAWLDGQFKRWYEHALKLKKLIRHLFWRAEWVDAGQG